MNFILFIIDFHVIIFDFIITILFKLILLIIIKLIDILILFINIFQFIQSNFNFLIITLQINSFINSIIQSSTQFKFIIQEFSINFNPYVNLIIFFLIQLIFLNFIKNVIMFFSLDLI